MQGSVNSISMQYYDTISPSVEISVLKTGFLFAASEYSNHVIYEITSIGDDDPKPVITYSTD